MTRRACLVRASGYLPPSARAAGEAGNLNPLVRAEAPGFEPGRGVNPNRISSALPSVRAAPQLFGGSLFPQVAPKILPSHLPCWSATIRAR